MAYYTDAIAKNPRWRFVDIYEDEGITGVMAKKRTNFMRMMRDCEKGKIDLILTKSVARFARNTVDSLNYVRRLKAKGIGVYFEEQALDSLKTENEMALGLYSVLAQAESENISANVRWGIRQRMQSGTFKFRYNLLGYPSAGKVTRYAIKKDTVFDRSMLRGEMEKLPAGYELKRIDADIYDQCLADPATRDFVAAFESKEKYLRLGRGMVILKGGKIVSGASSYTRYKEGIEIEVDTVEPERRKHLATIACSALILNCLAEGLYPSWDAQNMNSVHLAEKLGYELDHAYTAYEVV